MSASTKAILLNSPQHLVDPGGATQGLLPSLDASLWRYAVHLSAPVVQHHAARCFKATAMHSQHLWT